jgi:hypothetical protein
VNVATGSLTYGFSEEAKIVAEAAHQERRRLMRTNALGNEATFDELATVWEDCRQPNWDGYQALPVNQDTLRNAYVFLEALPLGSPSPSIGAEPDGELTLEWHRSARHTLSVSITPAGDLHFAALLGPNRIYGTQTFFGDVPERILNLIRQVFAA